VQEQQLSIGSQRFPPQQAELRVAQDQCEREISEFFWYIDRYWGIKIVQKCGRGSYGRFRALDWVWQKKNCKSIEIYTTNKIIKKYPKKISKMWARQVWAVLGR